MSHDAGPTSPLRFALTTLPAIALLVGVICYFTAEKTHAQLSKLGEHWYGSDSPLVPGYKDLRKEPVKPTCDPEKAFVAPKAEVKDELDDLLDDDEEDEKPAAPAKKDDEGDELDDLLGDEEGDASADAGAQVAAAKAAHDAALKQCKDRHAEFLRIKGRITPEVVRFRTIEQGVSGAVLYGLTHQQHVMILLLLICAITAAGIRGHIALRPAVSKLDHRICEGTQLAAHLILLYSAWSFRAGQIAAKTTIEAPMLHWFWIGGFAILSAISLHNIIRLPEDAKEGGSIGHARLTVPLFTIMCLVSGIYFLSKSHPAGVAIYLGKLPGNALLYIQVGLYVWVGMLVKRTCFASLAFDVVRPWKLPPEMLAFVAVVGAALPTAYSGASGIFVIAAGAVIYEELRKAGARRSLALAATAMSGSMGVVLRPCLLVVIVAALNDVTTDQLYGWGFKVFLLSAGLFLIVSLLMRQGPLEWEKTSVALPQSIAALKPLVPYAIIVTLLLLFEAFALNAYLDEHSAPIILPLILLVVLIYDRRQAKKQDAEADGFLRSVEKATSETTGHIGALLMLMGLSVCLGGIIEDAEVMNHVPQSFGSVWTTMLVLVAVLVVIGMSMDPYGAVILVSATIVAVAKRNGIDMVHFWMVVLVAFELGYLTPPVALNHLLSRQVVGEEEALAAEADAAKETSFIRRHEKILLPIFVMATALILVAFVPLMFPGYGK